MMTDEISEFLEKIDPEHDNCVYSCNGMTLMRSEEYNNRIKQIEELKEEKNKYESKEKDFKRTIQVHKLSMIIPSSDPLYPNEKSTLVVSKKQAEEYITTIFEDGNIDGTIEVVCVD